MYLFDWLFGKKEHVQSVASTPSQAPEAPPADVAQAVAPGTAIRYHPDLIGKLTQDHQRLLQRFALTQAAARCGDVVQAAQHLEEFRVLLQDHLLTENVRLYVYLNHALAEDGSSRQLIRSFRHEMDDIGKAVVAFLNDYRDLAQHPEFAKEFSQALEGIGKVLAERIRREEETLYPLYAA
jgi:regulator of sigma D